MTPHLNMRTPWKSIEDIKADYLLDVKESNPECYRNAEAALIAVHALNWNQCRAVIVEWAQEAYAAEQEASRRAVIAASLLLQVPHAAE